MSSGRISIRGEQTRELILTACRQLFTDRGYHRTSIYDVMEQSGIGKGALFHHWKSKEELALATYQGLEAHFESRYLVIARLELRAREKIDRLLRLLADASSDKNWVYGRLFAQWATEMRADEERIGPAVHRLRSRWSGMWLDLIRKAQQEHDLRADISAENLSFLVVSSIFGVLLMTGIDSAGHKSAFETLRRTLLT